MEKTTIQSQVEALTQLGCSYESDPTLSEAQIEEKQCEISRRIRQLVENNKK